MRKETEPERYREWQVGVRKIQRKTNLSRNDIENNKNLSRKDVDEKGTELERYREWQV